MVRRLARLRVPIGFAAFAMALWLARPTPASIFTGTLVALPGELLRVWAAGHLTRWREVTRSGPYRFVRHPLYVGSSVMGAGFAVATARPAVALVVIIYLGVTLTAAVRFEAQELSTQFGADYDAYREGRSAPAARGFSLRQVIANREYRAAAGMVAGLGLLWLRMGW